MSTNLSIKQCFSVEIVIVYDSGMCNNGNMNYVRLILNFKDNSDDFDRVVFKINMDSRKFKVKFGYQTTNTNLPPVPPQTV